MPDNREGDNGASPTGTTMGEGTAEMYNRDAQAIVRRELEAIAAMSDEERRKVATLQNQAVWIVRSLAEVGHITPAPAPSEGTVTISNEQRRSLVQLCWRKRWYPVEDVASEIIAALRAAPDAGEGDE